MSLPFLVYQTHGSNALEVSTQDDGMDQVGADQKSGRKALWTQGESKRYFTGQRQSLAIAYL